MRRVHLSGLAAAVVSLGLLPGVAVSGTPPTCWETPATITGNGVILGTDGPDVIVGSEGPDEIYGLGGNDLICGRGDDDVIRGGPGHDELYGGAGPPFWLATDGNDLIFGNRGSDTLRGEEGEDGLNGGAGGDDCHGAGAFKERCDHADFGIWVFGADTAPEGTLTFTVRVWNHGPDASGYAYMLAVYATDGATCVPPAWQGLYSWFGTLAPGAKRFRTYEVTCTLSDPVPWVPVPLVDLIASVDPGARDGNDFNDVGSKQTRLE